MEPVTYRGHKIEIRRIGYGRDADNNEAPKYAVYIDDQLEWETVPLGFAPAVFDATLGGAQELIDERMDNLDNSL